PAQCVRLVGRGLQAVPPLDCQRPLGKALRAAYGPPWLRGSFTSKVLLTAADEDPAIAVDVVPGQAHDRAAARKTQRVPPPSDPLRKAETDACWNDPRCSRVHPP